MVILDCNFEDNVVGLCYNNFECGFGLATKLLTIWKTCLVSNDFLRREINIESNCKVAVKILLGFVNYP